MSSIVTVSKGELRELVSRSCVAAGCSDEAAATIAANVVFCEAHFRPALAGLMRACDTGQVTDAVWVSAPAAIVDAIATVRDQGEAVVVFEAPVPLMAIAAAVSEAASKGCPAADLPPDPAAHHTIESVTLVQHDVGQEMIDRLVDMLTDDEMGLALDGTVVAEMRLHAAGEH